MLKHSQLEKDFKASSLSGLQTASEIWVHATLLILNEDEGKQLIAAAQEKVCRVPSDLLYMCEGMMDEDGCLLKGVQEVLKGVPMQVPCIKCGKMIHPDCGECSDCILSHMGVGGARDREKLKQEVLKGS